MNIVIKETNARESLEIIDPRTGVNWIQDFIGNAGALSDGQFEWDDELDAYVCDQETFDWWQKVVEENQELENRIFELEDKHGREAVYAVITDAGSNDLEDHARYVNQALDEAFGDE